MRLRRDRHGHGKVRCATGPYDARAVQRRMLLAYDRHPLQVDAILRRARRSLGDGSSLTQDVLAEDREFGLTDQNHIGGMAFVLALGSHTGITARSRVLDLGCGFGGSARVLASRFGCRVLGIDLSRRRILGARRLTRMLDLSDRVRFRVGDVMTTRVEPNAFDILWGQSAWVHLSDRRFFLSRWSRALRLGGRIAFEDAFLDGRSMPDAVRRVLARLQRQWNSDLTSRAEWHKLLAEQGYEVLLSSDLTKTMLGHFVALLRTAVRTNVDDREVQGWRDAVSLARRGRLKYGRIVAVKVRRRA